MRFLGDESCDFIVVTTLCNLGHDVTAIVEFRTASSAAMTRPQTTGGTMSLETQRLMLVPCAPAHIVTLIDQPERFEHVVGFRLAEELRAFFVSDDVSPDWLAAVRQGSDADPWRYGFFVVHREDESVVGSAGFKGPADANGVVEIAYGVVPQYQGQGYATEAAMALVKFAADRGQVRLVIAHTLPTSNASTRVLEKCGFVCVGSVLDPVDGEVWRWERRP